MYLEVSGLITIGTGVGQGDAVAGATQSVAPRLKALADPTRLALLHSLATAPSSVGELAVLFRLAQPTVSMHVKVLRENGLVRSQREGGRLRLSVDAGAVELLLHELGHAVLQGADGPQPAGASTTGSDLTPATVVDRTLAGRTRDFVDRKAPEQLLHEDPRLQAGDAGAETDVLAEAEGEVHGMGGTPHVEHSTCPRRRSARPDSPMRRACRDSRLP